jgi:ribonuclease HI
MIYIYTDGSCNIQTGIGGWSVSIIPDDDDTLFLTIYKHGTEVNTTNNRMELEAVYNALEFVSSTYPITECILYTDSAYIANCFKDKWYERWEMNGWLNSKKEPISNKDQWEKILNLYKNLRVEIRKVKAHGKNTENNLVDRIARKVRKKREEEERISGEEII